MMIALPVVNEDGLRARLSSHFGRTPFFAVIDSVTGDCRIFAAESLRHEGECAPLRALASMGVKEVLCMHMGRGALRRCFEHGMQVFQVKADRVADAMASRAAGECEDLPDSALCDHGQTGEVSHASCHKH